MVHILEFATNSAISSARGFINLCVLHMCNQASYIVWILNKRHYNKFIPRSNLYCIINLRGILIFRYIFYFQIQSHSLTYLLIYLSILYTFIECLLCTRKDSRHCRTEENKREQKNIHGTYVIMKKERNCQNKCTYMYVYICMCLYVYTYQISLG